MRRRIVREPTRGGFLLLPLLLLMLLGSVEARATLTPVGAPGEFTAH